MGLKKYEETAGPPSAATGHRMSSFGFKANEMFQEMPNCVGVTPLRAAARQGSFEMICLLVEAGAKQVFLEEFAMGVLVWQASV